MGGFNEEGGESTDIASRDRRAQANGESRAQPHENNRLSTRDEHSSVVLGV